MLERLRFQLRREIRSGDMAQAWFLAGIIVLYRNSIEIAFEQLCPPAAQ